MGFYATAWVQILATPIIGITMLLVVMERLFGIGVFRSVKRRRPAFISAPVLDLFAPGGVHHDTAAYWEVISDIFFPYFRARTFTDTEMIAFSSIAIASVARSYGDTTCT